MRLRLSPLALVALVGVWTLVGLVACGTPTTHPTSTPKPAATRSAPSATTLPRMTPPSHPPNNVVSVAQSSISSFNPKGAVTYTEHEYPLSQVTSLFAIPAGSTHSANVWVVIAHGSFTVTGTSNGGGSTAITTVAWCIDPETGVVLGSKAPAPASLLSS